MPGRPISVGVLLFSALRDYANKKGVNISFVASKAIYRFLKSEGENLTCYEDLTKSAYGNKQGPAGYSPHIHESN
jgi:hypothetical protein